MIVFLLSLSFFPCAFSFNFSSVPPAKTVQESKDLFKNRSDLIVNFVAQFPIVPFDEQNNKRFNDIALARIYKNENIDEISRVLEDPKSVAFAKYGTDITFIPGICQRKGDYDFALVDLVKMAYLGQKTLSPLAHKRLLNNLLTAKGDQHFTHFWLGSCGRYKDSENHILMTETSRYLTNQLIMRPEADHPKSKEYDNQKNGFPTWLSNHLQTFFVKGFEEYNSRPYEGYTARAIENLNSFAQDNNVQVMAHSLLDLMSATYAVQSSGLKRLPPWRRQPRFLGNPVVYSGDNSMDRYLILAGNYHYLSLLTKPFDYPSGEGIMLTSAISPYRVPDTILDLMITNQHKNYFQVFRHMGAELYSSSPHALISAGGTYINNFDFNTKERDGMPSPTTVMLSKDFSSDIRHWFRIEGHKNLKNRNNLCLTKGMACGLNIRVPSYIPQNCIERQGDWSFYNFSHPDCSYKYGLHLAVLQKKSPTSKCQKAADNYGLIELREASELSFLEFKNKILANKSESINCEGISHYRTTTGQEINFEIMPNKNYQYGIVAINNINTERDYRKWKRAFGDIINSSEEGKVFEIKNPYLKRKILLDVRDPLNPKRIESSY